MGYLRPIAALAAMLLFSCVSVPPEKRPEPSSSTQSPQEVLVPLEILQSPAGRAPEEELHSVSWESPQALDLETWPFGWVSVSQGSQLLGLPERIWTDQKLRWREALNPNTTAARSALRLEQVYKSSRSHDESLLSAWLLAGVNSRAGLGEQARSWIDRASELSSAPLLQLERSWDQALRLRDLSGARALWPGSIPWSSEDEARKAGLLRQKLFLSVQSLSSVGADEFISTQILDRDDLWAATWNGAVVRWSLATGDIDLVLPARAVSPIKFLAVTSWFLYAFQDQSLLRYSKVTGTWRSFPYPPGWTGLRVQGVVADGEESLWVAHLGEGLWRWDHGQWSVVDAGGGGPFLNALATNPGGGFWVGTKDRGLWSWNNGVWTAVGAAGAPDNISVIAADPDSPRWFIGTWGEGSWILEGGRLSTWSSEPDYVTAAVWTDKGPLWGALDQGLVWGQGAQRRILGPRDGLPSGGVSALSMWGGRWIWGTMGQGWGSWSEYENPALLR